MKLFAISCISVLILFTIVLCTKDSILNKTDIYFCYKQNKQNYNLPRVKSELVGEWITDLSSNSIIFNEDGSFFIVNKSIILEKSEYSIYKDAEEYKLKVNNFSNYSGNIVICSGNLTIDDNFYTFKCKCQIK